MKVFIFVMLVGSAAAAGSGPYLPSGWRPDGPAFYLPGENEKPSPNALKDQSFDVEASGSDFLREYGPPKLEVNQDITVQALPDLDTEKPFIVIGAKSVNVQAEEDGVIIENAELKEEEVIAVKSSNDNVESENNNQVIEVTTDITQVNAQDDTQTQDSNETPVTAEENVTLIEEDKVKNLVEVKENIVEKEIISEVNGIRQEVITEVKEVSEAIEAEVANINKEVTEVKSEITKVKEEVKSEVNREDEEQVASVNLETEIKNQQVQEDVPALKIAEEISTQNVPEGFLEYGPPGFREYGPPKEENVLNQLEEEKSVESNETRRRRFSPKFKALINGGYWTSNTFCPVSKKVDFFRTPKRHH